MFSNLLLSWLIILVQRTAVAYTSQRLYGVTSRITTHRLFGDPSKEPGGDPSKVPQAQRPVEEYISLIESPFFAWAQSPKQLLQNSSILYAITFVLVSYPISNVSFPLDSQILPRLISANFGTLAFLLAFLLRIFSGWSYVATRLQSSQIDFEETGWFDGGLEEKGPMTKSRDTLMYENDIKPPLETIRKAVAISALLFLLSAGALKGSLSSNKRFPQYSPVILENLQGNDKLAQAAQMNALQRGNRPTYCDSRYFKALANGGQGCD